MMQRLDAWMIAWNYLDGTGQIYDPSEAVQRLSKIFARLTKEGTTHPLALANRAISQYEREDMLILDPS
jgi:hypothetical protein